MRHFSFILVCLLCACTQEGDRPTLPDVLVETEHFRYYHQADDAPCPEFLDRLERHYLAVSDYLGVDLLGARKIDYYKFYDWDEWLAYCGGEYGCWDGTSVYASHLGIFPIGLVRAYLSFLGSPPEFFSAGAANFLAARYAEPWAEKPADFSLLDLFTDEAFRDSTRWPENVSRDDMAGLFSRLLVDRYGIDAYRAMYAGLNREMSFDEIDSVFQATFGETLGDAHTLWQGLLSRDDHFYHYLYLLECAGEAIVLPADDPVVISGKLECCPKEVKIRLESGDLALTSLKRSSLFLGPCTPTADDNDWLWPTFFVTMWVKEPPRDYFVSLRPTSQDGYPLRYELAMESRIGILGDRVEQAELQLISPPARYRLQANQASLANDYDSLAYPDAKDAVMRFTLDKPAKLWVDSGYDPAWVLLCPDDALPDDERCTLACQDGLVLGQQDLEAGVSYRLFIETIPGDYRQVLASLDFELQE